MKTSILALLLTASVVLFSCNSKQKEKQGYEQGSGQGGGGAPSAAFDEAPAIQESMLTASVVSKESLEGDAKSEPEFLGDKASVGKKIIKDGHMSVKTNDFYKSKKGFDDLLKKLNGYYESEDLQNNERAISYDLKIRVPADNFEKLISSIENGTDEIKSKSIQARNVTEEYVDIEMRLKNKREYLKRYKELLSKASTVKDIMAIEENIRILQEEIESKEGRLNYLSDQVSLSTLSVNLFKEKEFIFKPQPHDKFSERVKTSLSRGWTSVVEFVLYVVSCWPFIFVALLAFFAIRRFLKKRRSPYKQN